MSLRGNLLWAFGGAILAAVAAAVTLGYLLYALPYNGLYGTDSYAYAGQSLALLRELTGEPQPEGALFGPDGLPHWPIGYHAHLLLGRLLPPGGAAGGRLLTLALTVGAVALTYLLTFRLGGFLSLPARAVAGAAAAGALLTVATFTRTGTSLMSDVAAMFWALLACLLIVWAWPPPGTARATGRSAAWAAAAGAALGMAVFVRYSSVLVAVSIAAYLAVRYLSARQRGLNSSWGDRKPIVAGAAAVVAFGLVLAPQALYLLTHEAGPESGSYFASMTPGNILSRSSTGPDGPAAFPRTMIEFYLLSPLWDASGGFLSGAMLPLALLGIVVLLVRRQWAGLALIVLWWLVPSVAYATAPYQTHRYALVYFPAIVALLGLGAATGVEGFVMGLRRGAWQRALASSAIAVVAVLILAYGAVQGWRNVLNWQATHSAWQAADDALARAAVSVGGEGVRAVCMPACAPLDFYASMPARDLYNNDEAALADFIRPGATIAVFNEGNIATQWSGHEVETRRRWLDSAYTLEQAATSGEHTVYRVVGR